MYFYMKLKKNSVWYNFYQGTSVSITFYIFEHYQLWMMDSKAQRVFFPKTPKLCVWHTEVRSCTVLNIALVLFDSQINSLPSHNSEDKKFVCPQV